MKYPITQEQDKKIMEHLRINAWGHIYYKILTPQQRELMKRDNEFQRYVALKAEEHFKSMANKLGLSALLED